MAEVEIKSWERCRYAITADSGDEMAHELREHGINEIYGCKNRSVIRSGNFPTDNIHIRDGNSWLEIAWLKRTMISDELTENRAAQLRERVAKALEVCKSCPFYQIKIDSNP